jgi:hypothetical protein
MRGGGYVSLALVLLVVLVVTAWAANRTPPAGWHFAQRDRARWMMGTVRSYVAGCSANNTIKPTGVEVGDYICGVLDLTDPSQTQVAPSAMAVAANSITQSGTTWLTGAARTGSRYWVVVMRDQSDEGR